MRKKITSVIAITVIAAVTLTMFLLAFETNGNVVEASGGSLTLSLRTDNTVANAGDYVTVGVYASNFPHVTRFGPIDIQYDQTLVEMLSVKKAAALPDSFSVEASTVGGITSITGVDEAAEASINEYNLTVDGLDDSSEAPEFIDPSFSNEGETELCTISFRILSNATGNIRFSICGAVGFRDSGLNAVAVSIGDGTTTTISSQLSSDASLAELSISETTLAPGFDPTVLNYTASVSNSISDVAVNAVPKNLGASVIINGGANLQYGENTLTIDIVSQDQTTEVEYTVIITRQENYVPTGASIVDTAGNVYTFVDLPDVLNLPVGFSQTTMMVNSFEVPVFEREGVISVLIYVYDGKNSPAFYFYNPSNKVVTLYDSNNTIVRQSKILTVASIPVGVKVPDGFEKTVFKYGDLNISGYVNDDGELICYFTDENGDGRFYLFDQETQDFYAFKPADKTFESLYRVLFIVFLVITIIEAGMIFLVTNTVKRLAKERVNPKPRRV